MNINAERFLRITALLAAASAASCSSNTTNNSVTPATNGGAGGEATDDGGVGGANGKAGGGGGGAAGAGVGGGGASGSSSEAGTDDAGMADSGQGGAGSTCLDDTYVPPPVVDAGPDAAAESLPPCYDVPSAIYCQPDSGAEGFASAAYDFCWNGSQYRLKNRVWDAVHECLAALPAAEACTPKHTADFLACFDAAAAKACPSAAGDGGDPCTAIHAGCAAISMDDCHGVFNAFAGESGAPLDLSLCYPPTLDAGTCDTAFWACVLPYGVTR